jgi:polysaccharide biosynthesis protein PslG
MADILYGMNTHLPPPDHLDRLVAAGLRVARVDFNWAFIQPAPDRYEWAQTDRLLAEAAARALWLYPTLAHPPAWASGGGDWNSLPTSADLWYGFVASVVSRYHDRISAWSLWNEPNQGPITPAQYVNVVLEPGARAIRTYAPGSLVCGPELSTEGDWPSWLRQCLQRGGTFLDAVSVHSYQRNGREVVRAVLGGGWRWPWQDPPVVMVLQRADMAETPLLLTETGWNTVRVSEAEQASYYDQLLEALEGRAEPALVVGYQLADEPAPEQWGVLRQDLSPKPAYDVIRRRLVPAGRAIA